SREFRCLSVDGTGQALRSPAPGPQECGARRHHSVVSEPARPGRVLDTSTPSAARFAARSPPLALPQPTPATREASGPQHLRLRSALIRSAVGRTIGVSRPPDVVRRIRPWTPYRSLRNSSTRLTHGTWTGLLA